MQQLTGKERLQGKDEAERKCSPQGGGPSRMPHSEQTPRLENSLVGIGLDLRSRDDILLARLASA